LYAFFIQWSPNLEDDEVDEGFVVVEVDRAAGASETISSEPQLLQSINISKDWEVRWYTPTVGTHDNYVM